MGPVIIFDKSVLQGLNKDEAMWLDNFYLSNITPLFFIETLADLEKQVGRGRTPEDVVGNLAYKTPDMSAKPNAHHLTLLEGELFANAKLDMQYGRPHVPGGKRVELDGKTGVIFQQSPEEEAFSRWQRGEFLNVERLQAKSWRKFLSNIDLKYYYDFFQRFFPISKPKTLGGVKRLVDFYLDESEVEETLVFGLLFLGLTPESSTQILQKWRAAGKPNIKEFAPYFYHMLSVDFFFYTAMAADLISKERPSHKIDLAYLYYLPFCTVFSSSDKLHATLVPYFLRENQTFVPGQELKEDLTKLDVHYSKLPDEVKKRGVMSFAFYPPDDTSFLITRLWDKHMNPKWREHKIEPKPQPSTPSNQKMMDRIKRLKEEGKPLPDSTHDSRTEADEMIVERHVRAKKGKWVRFPPEVLNRRKNVKGEWEDIE